MQVDLTREEIEAILNAIEYAVERVQNSAGMSYEVRQQKLTTFEVVQQKIRRVLGEPTNT